MLATWFSSSSSFKPIDSTINKKTLRFRIIVYRKLKDARKDVAAAREEKDILSTEQQQLLREKTKLELAIKDLTDDVDGDNKSKVCKIA